MPPDQGVGNLFDLLEELRVVAEHRCLAFSEYLLHAIQFRNAQPLANRTDAVSLQNRSFPQCHEESCRAIGSYACQSEIDRRREAAQRADPLRKREEELLREQARVEMSSERLVTTYQEGLLTLPQLRQRMPALH